MPFFYKKLQEAEAALRRGDPNSVLEAKGIIGSHYDVVQRTGSIETAEFKRLLYNSQHYLEALKKALVAIEQNSLSEAIQELNRAISDGTAIIKNCDTIARFSKKEKESVK